MLFRSISIGELVYLYDNYVGTPGSVSGNVVGTCRVSGVSIEDSTTARLYLFNVSMYSGKDFSRNVKSIGLTSRSFTANLRTDLYSKQLTGNISTTDTALTGVGTRFLSQLKENDAIYWSTPTGGTVISFINSITSDTMATLYTSPSTAAASSTYFLQLASVIEPNNVS